jgi:hypothetical protein
MPAEGLKALLDHGPGEAIHRSACITLRTLHRWSTVYNRYGRDHPARTLARHPLAGRGRPAGDGNDRTSCLAAVAVCPWRPGPDWRDQAPGQAGTRPRSASDSEAVVDQPRAPDSSLVLSGAYLLCSVNDAVNILPCSTCAYLTAGFPEQRFFTRTTLAFRPPPDYGSGGWGFESLAARTISPGQRPGLMALLALSAEDGAVWTSFLRGLVARGLHGVRLVVSDAHGG